MNRRRQPGRAVSRVHSYEPAPYAPAHHVYQDGPGRTFAGGLESELRTYVDIFRRRARLLAWTVVLIVSAALAYTLLKPPVYRATSLIELRGGGDAPDLEALFAEEDPTAESLRTHFGLLSSAQLAERVLDELDLFSHPEFNPDLDKERQEVVAAFLERLVVDPVEESRLVMINFDAHSAELASRIVNQVVDSYRDLRVEEHEDAARRVGGQADSVEIRLAQAEARLRDFAAENDLPFLVEQDLTAQIGAKLTDLQTRLSEAQGTRFENESLYDVVVRDGRRDLVDDEGLQTLELRLSELRGEHARMSATFTEDYPALAELSRQIEQVETLIEEERNRLAARVESDYRLALQREANINEAIDEQAELANALGPATGDYHVLRQAVLANRELYATLLNRERQAEIVAAIGATDVAIVDRATPPLEPYRPVFAMNIGLALMLGLVLGVCVVFIREVFDGTVQTADDFPVSEDVPVLAMIPAIGVQASGDSPVGPPPRRQGVLPWPGREGRRPIEATWPRIDRVDRRNPVGSALADSFGALRTAVLFKDDDVLPRSILVSSCRAGEGKTTVSVNFAMSLAQLGNRVLLIDADLRRPAVHRALKVPASPGLIHCLTNGVRWQEVVQYSVAGGLDVLSSGGATSRAGDLLAGGRIASLLRRAEEQYDYVIVDAPALFINASDARVLSQLVDGVVVVVRSRSTPRVLVDRIPRAIPNVIGVVVNDLRKDSLPGYFADYFADYGSPPNHPNNTSSKNSEPWQDPEDLEEDGERPIVSTHAPQDHS